MEGDTQKDLTLTQARAMVVREYLTENYAFDDSQLKTLGLGKQAGASLDADWGSIRVLLYPAGAPIPPGVQPPVASPAKVDTDKPAKSSISQAPSQ
jgi:hypothetical protein